MITAVKTALLTMVVVAVQVMVFPHLRASGVMPELVLAVALAAGSQSGARTGALVGFGAGLLYDAQLSTAFGLYALTGCLVGYVVGAFRSGLADSVGRVTWVISMAEMAAAIALLVACSQLIGGANFYPGNVGRTLVIATLYTTAFLPVLHRLYRFALGSGEERRSSSAPLRLAGGGLR